MIVYSDEETEGKENNVRPSNVKRSGSLARSIGAAGKIASDYVASARCWHVHCLGQDRPSAGGVRAKGR